MSVPEAAVYEDHGSVPLKYNVWSSGKRRVVEPEAQAGSVQSGAKNSFRPRVLTPDAGHVPAALFSG
jgi:hypothetical protein